MGTVRGTFDLNSRPASSSLRDLRKEGVETDAVFEKLGKSLDGVGTTKQREQIRLYKEAVKRLGTQWEQSAAKADASWTEMEKKTVDSVAVQSAAIDSLQGRLNELGRTRSTAEVNTSGIAESITEVELLKKRLNELDRFRATARVGVGGTGLSAARTAVGGGGGGGSGFSRGGLKIPFAGSIPLPLVAGALGAAPPFLGAATAVLGSAGSAALGAGAIGTAGLGALAAGIGSIASVAIPAVKGLKESHKALLAYNKAVATNGKNSTQAHTALAKLNAALQSAPAGTRGVLNQEQRLSSRFQSMTKPGQASFMGSLSNLLGAGNRLTPQLAGIANPLLAAGQSQSGRFGNFLTGGTTRSFLGASGNTAIEVLPNVESTFQHVLATLMNISRASMPFFKQSVEWLETWTAGWATSTGNIGKTRTSIGGMVSQLKTWGRLTSATFKLLRDLFSSSAKPGQSLVGDLTTQLNTWDAWIKRNPRQVRAFFTEAVDSTEKIAGALGKITGMLWKLGQLLTPLLTQLSQFVGFLDSAGLLSPGMLPLLLASGAGIRNVVGAARGRILGSAAGGAGGAVGTTEGLAAGALLGRGGAAALGGRAMFGPISGLGKTYGLARSFGYSRTAAAAAEAGALPGAGTFARGFGARFLPIAALMAGLNFASTPGGVGDRLQGAESGLTLGLIPPPKTGAQKEEGGAAHARRIAEHYNHKYGTSLKGLDRQVAAIRRSRQALMTPQERGGFTGFLTTDLNPIGGNFGHAPKIVSDEDRAAAASLHKELLDLQTKRRTFAAERGGELGGQFRGAFQIRSAHEGAQAALGDVSGPILASIKRLGPAGGQALARNVLAWTSAAKQHNPKLQKQYQELAEKIEASFARMGKRIKVINGEIYTGSSKEWGNIERAMKTPVERARAAMIDDFTAIQIEAVRSLRAMGYSPTMAHKIVQGMESKNNQTRGAAEGAAKQGPGGYNSKILQGASGPPSPGGARGLRIPGYGNTDHVPIGGHTGIGAPGELIVNPHTEARANRYLGAFGTSLEQMQKGEKYRASTPVGQMYGRPGEFARGGRMGGGGAWRGVGPAGLHSGVRKVVSSVLGQFPGLSATSTTGGSHVSGSYHYLGEAVDIAGSSAVMHAASEWIKKSGLYRQLTEGIHNPNLSVSDGHMVDPSFYASVWGEHADHIHLAVAHAVGKLLGLGGGARGRGMGGGGFGGRSIRLKGRRSGLGGAPGAMQEAGSRSYAKGLEDHINKQIGGGRGRGGRFGRVAGGSVPAQIARVLSRGGLNKIGAAGIIGNAYAESTWNPAAQGYGGGGLWGFTASPNSLADLQAYAQQRNTPWTSAGLQTQFLLQHVSRGLIGRLNASSSPEAAAALFMTEFERPGIPRQDVREAGARKAFKMGFARGGRIPLWGGWNAHGGSGSFDRPTLLGVGERGREDVQIRPHKPERKRAGGRSRRGAVEISFAGAHFHVRHESDIEKIADEVGRRLTAAMAEDDGFDQEEVMG